MECASSYDNVCVSCRRYVYTRKITFFVFYLKHIFATLALSRFFFLFFVDCVFCTRWFFSFSLFTPFAYFFSSLFSKQHRSSSLLLKENKMCVSHECQMFLFFVWLNALWNALEKCFFRIQWKIFHAKAIAEVKSGAGRWWVDGYLEDRNIWKFNDIWIELNWIDDRCLNFWLPDKISRK